MTYLGAGTDFSSHLLSPTQSAPAFATALSFTSNRPHASSTESLEIPRRLRYGNRVTDRQRSRPRRPEVKAGSLPSGIHALEQGLSQGIGVFRQSSEEWHLGSPSGTAWGAFAKLRGPCTFALWFSLVHARENRIDSLGRCAAHLKW